jgi:outer membrane beta-barrel protein
MKKLLVTAVLAVMAFGPVAAHAKRKNPLEGQPAVRKRVKFLKHRFEVTPRLGLTFLQDFKHNFLLGLSAEFHVTRWLSFGVFFDYAVVNWDTDLTNEIEATLPDELNQNTAVDPSPSRSIMKDALDTLQLQAGVFASYSPWFGKLSLFGKVFAHFDFYILAGAGFALLEAGTFDYDGGGCNGDFDRDGDCPSQVLYIDRRKDNGGFKVGPLVGFGVRFRILRWIAIHAAFHSIFIKRNAAGFDRTGDTFEGLNDRAIVIVDEDDESWVSLMSFTIGVSFLFPMQVDRTP